MLSFLLTTASCSAYVIIVGKSWILKTLNSLLAIYKKQLINRKKQIVEFNSGISSICLPHFKFANTHIVPKKVFRPTYEQVTLPLVELCNTSLQESIDRTQLNELKSEIRSLKGILLTKRNLFPGNAT